MVILGEVGLFFSTNPKNPYITIRENETFGEMGVIDNELRQSRSSCLSDFEVVQIERELFIKKYKNSDTLVKALSMCLREANKN